MKDVCYEHYSHFR